MEENKDPDAQAPSKEEQAPQAKIEEAAKQPPPPAEEKKVEKIERELNPAVAAREAIFNVVRDNEMTPDEKVSAIAPLIKTVSEHRMISNNPDALKEIELTPRAQKRWSMLDSRSKPVIKPVDPEPPASGVLSP